MSLSSETSITQWLEWVKQGPDDSAAQHLWERYCKRLAVVARKRFMALGAQCRAEDECRTALHHFYIV
jgi:hypothetical protein